MKNAPTRPSRVERNTAKMLIKSRGRYCRLGSSASSNSCLQPVELSPKSRHMLFCQSNALKSLKVVLIGLLDIVLGSSRAIEHFEDIQQIPLRSLGLKKSLLSPGNLQVESCQQHLVLEVLSFSTPCKRGLQTRGYLSTQRAVIRGGRCHQPFFEFGGQTEVGLYVFRGHAPIIQAKCLHATKHTATLKTKQSAT